MSRVLASQRSKAIPILGAAGLSLTLTSGVSVAAGSTPHEPARNAAVSQEMTLGFRAHSPVASPPKWRTCPKAANGVLLSLLVIPHSQ
jgi:hypothetical protein